MTRPVFVLRPEPGLSATMARAREMGLAVEAMPLSAAEPLDWTMPEGTFDGILLGSANGLRLAGERREALSGLPVYAVGEATAAAARELGFAVAHTGSGGLQGLLDGLDADRPLKLLRLAGEERISLDLPRHVTLATATTYRVVHHPLDRARQEKLAAGGVVLLHSGASARHFASECARQGVDRSRLALAALAPRVVASVSDGWESVRIASTPDDGALLSLTADMCH